MKLLRPVRTRAGSDLDYLELDSILSALVKLLGANRAFTQRSASAF